MKITEDKNDKCRDHTWNIILTQIICIDWLNKEWESALEVISTYYFEKKIVFVMIYQEFIFILWNRIGFRWCDIWGGENAGKLTFFKGKIEASQE